MSPHFSIVNSATKTRFHSLIFWMLIIFNATVFFSCKKDEKIQDPGISGSIGGANFQWNASVNGIENHASSGFGNDCSTNGILVYQQSGFTVSPGTESLYFAMSACADLQQNMADQSLAAIHQGTFSFGNVLLQADVAQIIYVDTAGISWKSFAGSAKQDSSHFEIISVSNSGVSSAMYRIHGKFSCSVYKDSGEEKKLENVEFYALSGIIPSF